MLGTTKGNDPGGKKFVFPIYDEDGELVVAVPVLDSECSIDGGTFIDCINEAAEIPRMRGIYSLVLTRDEKKKGDRITVITKPTAGDAITAVSVYYKNTRALRREISKPDVQSILMNELGG